MTQKSPHKKQPHDPTNALGKIEAIFAWPENDYGEIEAPSKEGLLEIARLGKDAWNVWRDKYRNTTIDFSHTDFRKLEIDFREYDFAISEDYSKKASVTFAGSIFGKTSSFSRCNFGGKADFSNAIFEDLAIFYGSLFTSDANFRNAVFYSVADFALSNFEGYSYFEHAEFHGPANFFGVALGRNASFKNCIFRGWAEFSASADENQSKDHSIFQEICFSGAKFHKRVSFSGRKFESTTDFGRSIKNDKGGRLIFGEPTTFHEAPLFHGCKLHQDTNFEGAIFFGKPSPVTARAYRTLKLAMEQLKATREEQRFFLLEIKAEHPHLKPWPRLMSSIYATTSEYGFSLLRPITTLVLTTLVVACLHGWLINMHSGQETLAAALPSPSGLDTDRTMQWARYVAINTLPVPGFDKPQMELRDALFGKDGVIVSVAMGLEMIHKVISLGCVFLLGLALRNLFKMKS